MDGVDLSLIKTDGHDYYAKISDKYYSSGLDSLGDYSVLIGLGATISLNDYFISIGFSEDLKVNSVPDITFVSSLQKRF